jgi:replication-associated recombination protein RarA
VRLYEKYRPTSLDDVVGQNKAVAQVRKLIARGSHKGAALWITGPSGSGKTTLARIIAKELAGESTRIHEYRTADDLNASEIEKIDAAYRINTRGLFQIPQAVIVNEAHGLNARQVRTLLGLLEGIPESFVWIFTTTWDGDNWLEDNAIDAAPLKSRCFPVALTNQGTAEAFACLMVEVANKDGITPKPVADYVKLARKCGNNCRSMLMELEAGAD